MDSSKYIAPPNLAVSRPSDLKRKYIGAFGLNGDKSGKISVTTTFLANKVPIVISF